MPFQDKSLQRFKRGEVPCCQTSPDSKNLSKLAFICDKNGAPVVELLVLMFSGECPSICTVWPQVPLRGVANLCNPHGVCFWQFGQKYAHELPAGGTLAVYDPFLLTQKILILWLNWCPSTSLSCSPRATALLLVPLPHSCNCGATHKKPSCSSTYEYAILEYNLYNLDLADCLMLPEKEKISHWVAGA